MTHGTLVFQLVTAAEGHEDSVRVVFGTTRQAISSVLQGRRWRPHWRRFRAEYAREERRAGVRRGWWRWRLKNMGIDAHLLPVTDPLWPMCHRRPRGALFRDVVAQLQAELPPGTPLIDHAEEILRRVARLKRLSEVEQRKALGVPLEFT